MNSFKWLFQPGGKESNYPNAVPTSIILAPYTDVRLFRKKIIQKMNSSGLWGSRPISPSGGGGTFQCQGDPAGASIGNKKNREGIFSTTEL